MDDSSVTAPIDPALAVRAEIDRVDAELLDLIGKRLRLAEQAGPARLGEGGGPLRPARDIKTLRRLLAAAPTHVDPELVHEVWRALLGASVRRQGALEIITAGGPDPGKLFDLARRHFGAAARIQRLDDARTALARAIEHQSVVCVLPWIGKTGAGMWWPILAESRFSALNVIGALPMRSDAPEPDAALVTAHGVIEPAGGDVTLAIAFDSKFKLQRAMAEAGLKGAEVARAAALVLLRLDGHLHPDDLRPALLSKAGLDGFRVVGSYARV